MVSCTSSGTSGLRIWTSSGIHCLRCPTCCWRLVVLNSQRVLLTVGTWALRLEWGTSVIPNATMFLRCYNILNVTVEKRKFRGFFILILFYCVILQRVGRQMGLETQKLSSLWKDQALVAINVAVMHSFQVKWIYIANKRIFIYSVKSVAWICSMRLVQKRIIFRGILSMKVLYLKSNQMQILQNNIQKRLYDLIRITHQFTKTSCHDLFYFFWLLDSELKYIKIQIAKLLHFHNFSIRAICARN